MATAALKILFEFHFHQLHPPIQLVYFQALTTRSPTPGRQSNLFRWCDKKEFLKLVFLVKFYMRNQTNTVKTFKYDKSAPILRDFLIYML